MKKLLCYIILFILAIFVFAGTGTRGIINNNDTCFPLFSAEELNLNLYTWYYRTNFGKDNYLNLLILPSIFLKGLLDILGFKLWLINRIWFVGALFFMGTSMFYFTSSFFKNKNGYMPRLIGAIFFMLNPYVFNRISGGHVMMLWELASIVYMFGFFIKGLENPSQIHKYAILFGMLSVFNGIVIRVVALLVLGLYFLLYLLFNINKTKTIIYAFRFAIESILVVFILNCFWVLPVVNVGAKDIVSGVYGDTGDWNSLVGTSPFIKIYWVIRLLYGIFTVLTPYPRYLISPYGISIWFILLYFIYSGLFFVLKSKKEYFFYALAIIAAYFATGLNYSFISAVYKWSWIHFKPFQVFRNPEKFQAVLLFSYAVLLCITCREMSLKLMNHKYLSKMLYLIILVLVLANSWVFFTGDLLGEVKPAEVPEYYYKLREYLQNDKYVRLISLPIQWLLYNYCWAPYCMGDILYNISPISVVNKIPGENLSGIKELLLYKKYYKAKEFISPILFGLCNIKYVLLQEDLYCTDKLKIKKTLDQGLGKEYKEKKTFGQLSLYEISDKSILPYIYTSSKANWILNDIQEYGILSYSRIFNYNPILIFSELIPDNIDSYRLISFNKYAEKLRYNGETIYVFQGKKSAKGSKRFFISNDGYYFIQGRIVPKIFKKKYSGSRYLFDMSGEVANWESKPVNSTMEYNIENAHLKISCFFDGNSKEDEYAQFKKRIDGVDLVRYPWIGLYYKVSDPTVQTIEIVIGLDFNSDDNVDAHIRGLYPVPASTKWDWFIYNVFERAKEMYPNQMRYKVINIEIYPHKLWGADCGSNKKGKYDFYIKELLFYRESPVSYLLSSNGRLVLPKGYEFFRDIYKLDEKVYSFKKTFLDKGDAKEEMFKEKIWLGKGMHGISFKKNSSFDMDWVMIEPVNYILFPSPKVEFERINPTKYIVRVTNAGSPFWLIFNESFNKGWQAFFNDGCRCKIIKNHYKANGYANAWYVEKIKNKEMKIIIEFIPQRWFCAGGIISILSILCCMLYFFWGRFKKNV